MPFSLTNAPATIQRLMEMALNDLPNCFAYLDDIYIYIYNHLSSGSIDDHLAKLEKFFNCLLEFGLKLRHSKCHLTRIRSYQQQNGKSRVIAYASRGLKPSEVNYPAHKLEFLALKWAVCDKFQDNL